MTSTKKHTENERLQRLRKLIWLLVLLPEFALALENQCSVDREPLSDWINQQNERTWRDLGDGFWLDDFDRDERLMDRVSDSRRSLPSLDIIGKDVHRRQYGVSWWIDRQSVDDWLVGRAQFETIIAERDLPDDAYVKSAQCDESRERCVALVSYAGEDANEVWLKQHAEWYKTPNYPSKSTALVADDGSLWFVAAEDSSDQTSSGYPRSLYQVDVTGHSERMFQTAADHVGMQVFSLNDRVILQEWLSYGHARYWFVDQHQLRSLPLPSSAILRGFDGEFWYATLRHDWRNLAAETLFRFKLNGSGVSDITPIFEPSDTQTIDDVQVSPKQLWFSILDNVSSRLFSVDRDTLNRREWLQSDDFQFISIAYSDNQGAIVRRESFIDAPRIYRLSGGNQQPDSVELVREATPGFDASGAKVFQYFATSRDGTLIPYFVVTQSDEPDIAPTLMYVYGGFSANQVPSYLGPAGALWVAKGAHYVVVNARGGAEYGADWHRIARRQNKRLTIEDVNAVAESLIDEGWTRPQHLGVRGSSNGGLMAMSAAVEHPDYYAAVAAHAPLADMLNFTSFGVGITWLDEYGDPKNPQDHAVLESYSPLHNVSDAEDTPAYFISVSANDDRVGPEHARRFVSRLACLGHRFYYWELPEGGHNGFSSHSEYVAQQIMMYQFFWNQLEIN